MAGSLNNTTERRMHTAARLNESAEMAATPTDPAVGGGIDINRWAEFQRAAKEKWYGLDWVYGNPTTPFAVLHKPAGVSAQQSEKGDSIDKRLRVGYHMQEVYYPHRLDKHTSGLLVVAFTRSCAKKLGLSMEAGQWTKRYRAVVQVPAAVDMDYTPAFEHREEKVGNEGEAGKSRDDADSNPETEKKKKPPAALSFTSKMNSRQYPASALVSCYLNGSLMAAELDMDAISNDVNNADQSSTSSSSSSRSHPSSSDPDRLPIRIFLKQQARVTSYIRRRSLPLYSDMDPQREWKKWADAIRIAPANANAEQHPSSQSTAVDGSFVAASPSKDGQGYHSSPALDRRRLHPFIPETMLYESVPFRPIERPERHDDEDEVDEDDDSENSQSSRRHASSSSSSRSKSPATDIPKKAITEFRLLAHNTPRRLALYDVALHTGRTHQIRIHCADAGLPVVNDPYYNQCTIFEAMRQAAVLMEENTKARIRREQGGGKAKESVEAKLEQMPPLFAPSTIQPTRSPKLPTSNRPRSFARISRVQVKRGKIPITNSKLLKQKQEQQLQQAAAAQQAKADGTESPPATHKKKKDQKKYLSRQPWRRKMHTRTLFSGVINRSAQTEPSATQTCSLVSVTRSASTSSMFFSTAAFTPTSAKSATSSRRFSSNLRRSRPSSSRISRRSTTHSTLADGDDGADAAAASPHDNGNGEPALRRGRSSVGQSMMSWSQRELAFDVDDDDDGFDEETQRGVIQRRGRSSTQATAGHGMQPPSSKPVKPSPKPTPTDASSATQKPRTSRPLTPSMYRPSTASTENKSTPQDDDGMEDEVEFERHLENLGRTKKRRQKMSSPTNDTSFNQHQQQQQQQHQQSGQSSKKPKRPHWLPPNVPYRLVAPDPSTKMAWANVLEKYGVSSKLRAVDPDPSAAASSKDKDGFPEKSGAGIVGWMAKDMAPSLPKSSSPITHLLDPSAMQPHASHWFANWACEPQHEMMLHAYFLQFPHPTKHGHMVTIEQAIPQHWKELMQIQTEEHQDQQHSKRQRQPKQTPKPETESTDAQENDQKDDGSTGDVIDSETVQRS